MVGKGDSRNSRIFSQCYLKCCKLQNLTPLNIVHPSGNGKVLDFCVDRIKYVDWPPILNALSCDLSLHSVSIRCRQQVKTVLEHIDCERLAKTVNKRAVILTNFMLNNLMEAISQLLTNTTLLTALQLEGLPLKIPYLNPLSEVLSTNSSLQHIYLPRCLIGDAGCLALCKAVRCLPNILTMDLSACELTPLGAGYIADLIKYQKIHRYSENWVHTLRYRLPELDTMAGLRRISLCGNQLMGDAGIAKLLDVLADDLWIKALDVQNCGLSEECATAALQTMASNTTLVVLDTRHNPLISNESVAKIRSALRENERGIGGQYSWLGNQSSSSEGRTMKSVAFKNGMSKERHQSNGRTAPNKYVKANIAKKEKEYTEVLEEQLQDETTHRRQLEELNERLVCQMRELRHRQLQLWQNSPSSSEQSFQASSRSGGLSTSSGSTSSVPIDQNTLSYIQQAFKDIYAFIKNNQCQGQCLLERSKDNRFAEQKSQVAPTEVTEVEQIENRDVHVNIVAKKAQSTHTKLIENAKMKKITQSAHLLGEMHVKGMKLEMLEKQMGDTKNAHGDEQCILKEAKSPRKDDKRNTHGSPCDSVVSDSSDTLVYSPKSPRREGAYGPLSVETVFTSPRRESAYAPLSVETVFTSPRRESAYAPLSVETVFTSPRQSARRKAVDFNPRDAMYSSSDEDS